jgi:hypothetical protein
VLCYGCKYFFGITIKRSKSIDASVVKNLGREYPEYKLKQITSVRSFVCG